MEKQKTYGAFIFFDPEFHLIQFSWRYKAQGKNHPSFVERHAYNIFVHIYL